MDSDDQAVSAVSHLEGPRSPQVEELPAVIALSNEVFEPAGASMGLQFPLLFSPDNLEGLRVFSDRGKPVALVGYIRQAILVEGHRLPVGSIGSVCTAPAYRGLGLAGKLVSDVLERLRAAGVPVALISGDRGLYKRLGCVEAGRFERFEVAREVWAGLSSGRCGERAPQACDTLFRLFEEDDLELLHQLYRREPLRFFRTREQFDRLIWRHPELMRLYAEEKLLVACRGQRQPISAYLVTRARTMQDGSRRVHIVEYAGSREDIISALGFIFAEFSPSVVTFTVPGPDRQFLRLLSQRGLVGAPCTLPGHTLFINSLRMLMEKLSFYVEERTDRRPGRDVLVSDEPGTAEGGEMRWVLRVGDEEAVIPGRAVLTRLVFGGLSEEELDGLAGHGPLRVFLERAFPVPLPVPGLNYV